MAERELMKEDDEIRMVGAKVTGTLGSALGREVLKTLRYSKSIVKTEPSEEYVEPLESDEEREIVKMEKQRASFPQAGPSQVESNDVSMRYSKVLKKYYFPTGIPDILQVKQKHVTVHSEEVKNSTEVLFKKNRRYLSLVDGQRYCGLCGKTMTSSICLALHLRGRLHKNKVTLDLGLH